MPRPTNRIEPSAVTSILLSGATARRRAGSRRCRPCTVTHSARDARTSSYEAAALPDQPLPGATHWSMSFA
jgi:hypothetical protein